MMDPITKDTPGNVKLDQALLQRIRPTPGWRLCRRHLADQVVHVTYKDRSRRVTRGEKPTPGPTPMPLCRVKGAQQDVMFQQLGPDTKLCGVCYRRLGQIGAL